MKPTRPQHCDLAEVESRLNFGCSPTNERRTGRHHVIGTIRIRQHCEFAWRQAEGEVCRYVSIGEACEECQAALSALLGEDLRFEPL